MDPALVLKSVVCAVAIVGAVVLAAMGKLEAREALEHSRWVLGFWVGGMALVSAASKFAGRPTLATLEQLAAPLVEPAPPTSKSPKLPPALPGAVMAIGGALFGCAALAGFLTACTPSERADAATAARVAEPVCEAGFRLLAGAPELAPFCVGIPEAEAAVAELVAEYEAAHPAPRGAALAHYDPPAAAVQRRVFARRQGGHQ